MVGTLGRAGNRYIITSKLVEVETSIILQTSESIFSSFDTLIDDIPTLAAGLVVDLEPDQEKIKGEIAEPVFAMSDKDGSTEKSIETTSPDDEERSNSKAAAAERREEYLASHEYLLPGAITTGTGVLSLSTGGILLYLSYNSLAEARRLEEEGKDYDLYVQNKTTAKNQTIAGLIVGGIGVIGVGVGVFLMLINTSGS